MNKMAKTILFCPIISCTFLLSGCASIVSGTSESVSVMTTPVSRATCTLTNGKGTWYIPETPGSVVVHKSSSYLNVDCQKAGYYDGYAAVKSKLKPMIAGNIIFGGAIGAGVDAYDGAGFAYPTNIQVLMTPRGYQ